MYKGKEALCPTRLKQEQVTSGITGGDHVLQSQGMDFGLQQYGCLEILKKFSHKHIDTLGNIHQTSG